MPAVAFATVTPCYWAGTTVKCFPSTGIFLDNSRTLRLGTNDTTHYIELASPTGVGTSYTWTLPGTQGATNRVIVNDGSGVLSWAQITSPSFFSSGAAATSSAAGTVTNESTSTPSVAFTGPRSSTKTFTIYRIGGHVTMRWADDVGASCTANFFTSSGAIPSGFRPAASVLNYPVFVQDNGASQTVMGVMQIDNGGTISILKTNASNNFTNGANCGYQAGSITWQTN